METDVKFGPSHSVMVKSEVWGEQVLPQHSWEPLSAGLGSAFLTLHQEVKPTPMPSCGRTTSTEAAVFMGGGMWREQRGGTRVEEF